jgi:DNA-binding Lrp family transcriptional regulator
MTDQLTTLQKQLCNALQQGLPICPRPYADLAEFLGADEQTILHEIRRLKDLKIIRRIAPAINHRTLGKVSTLVTAHVPQQDVPAVAEVVNALDGVSHNYLRKHHYNLWFTLQAGSTKEIDALLTNVSARFGIDFHSLPVEHFFKLDVRFDVLDHEQTELAESPKVPADDVVELTDAQKHILSRLQRDLDITTTPFDYLCRQDLGEQDVLNIMRTLIDNGVIKRISAVLDYRRLGFTANVMFCCAVRDNNIVPAGETLARFGMVSHCYHRRIFEGWPYNLFAMMHARSMGEIQRVVDKFVRAHNIDDYQLLPTEAELKKRPVRQSFDDDQ